MDNDKNYSADAKIDNSNECELVNDGSWQLCG